MTKTIQLLFIALAVQTVLAIGIWLGGSNSGAKNANTPLIDLDFAIVDGITLRDNENHEAVLVKNSQAWGLEGYGDLKVNTEAVEKLLDKLKALQKGWPVAASESALERFEVADSNAQKVLTLKKSGKVLATLYMGTSPGHRKLHVRLNDENAVYAVVLAQFDAGADVSDWLDKAQLQVKDPITRVKTDNFALSKTENDWTITPLEETHEAASDAISTWVDRFTSLRIDNLPDAETTTALTSLSPTFSAQLSAGTEHHFDFYKKDDDIFVTVDSGKQFFEVGSYQANPILDASLDSFRKVKTVDAPSEELTTEGNIVPVEQDNSTLVTPSSGE